MKNEISVKKPVIAVIGGGPAGCLAAIKASENGAEVHLFEQNDKIGKKLYITGKGRCNLTNAKPVESHIAHIHRNPKFLYSSYARFSQDDIVRFFEDHGLPMKTERGDRVFPVSDKSSDVIRTLDSALRQAGVKVHLNEKITSVKKSESGFHIGTNSKNSTVDSVVIATGGLSYPTTGALGDGYRFAEAFGHHVTPLTPALVGLQIKGDWCKERSGLTLKNVSLIAKWAKKPKEFFGELLFTHYGISGPIVLTLSSVIPSPTQEFSLFLNLKPALSPETLTERIGREIENHKKSQLSTLMRSLLPQSLIQPVLEGIQLDPSMRTVSLTEKEIAQIVHILQNFPLEPDGFRGFNEAVITRGGVDVKGIDAKTMMSKQVEGLFFAGEILDTDAETGGYNLQIAWSTGALAGASAAAFGRQKKGGNA